MAKFTNDRNDDNEVLESEEDNNGENPSVGSIKNEIGLKWDSKD